MDKYTELEKLSSLKEKGIISESEFELEKAKILAKSTDRNQISTKAEETASQAEIELIENYDKKQANAKKLAATGIVAKNYLIVSFFAALFFGISYDSLARDTKEIAILVFGAIFGLPTIFILPIFLMRTKKRNIAQQEAKTILEEIASHTDEVNRIKEKFLKSKIAGTNANESFSSPNLPLVHGTVSQQWLAIVLMQLAIGVSCLTLSTLLMPRGAGLSMIFFIICNIIVFPISWVGSAICNVLSKILVSFTSTRTWWLTSLIAGYINIGLGGLIAAGIYAAEIKFSFENIYRMNMVSIIIGFVGYLGMLFVTLVIGGRIVWRRRIADVIKAVCIPYGLMVVIIITLYFVMRGQMRNQGF